MMVVVVVVVRYATPSPALAARFASDFANSDFAKDDWAQGWRLGQEYDGVEIFPLDFHRFLKSKDFPWDFIPGPCVTRPLGQLNSRTEYRIFFFSLRILEKCFEKKLKN